ncbi:DUF4157 domain-containing protein [Methylocaldum sp. 14B]|uniref:eCIS core domain-containing protein n=1 Tax=Methylocaldum sp. 14B TaxID=1912213 RepID=UPI00098BCC7D|nr:DUF4157 domain-containing protein [Methylocaldum sp. 14B]
MRQAATLQTAQAKSHSSRGQIGQLQRKCACGGPARFSGECEECGKKKVLGIQSKRVVSEPGDPYEREADRVAEEVMAKPAHGGNDGIPPRVPPMEARVRRPLPQRKGLEHPTDVAPGSSIPRNGNTAPALSLRVLGHGGSVAAPWFVQDVLRSPGRGIESQARARLESSFGCDFSAVRVHDDAAAARSAAGLQARAYAVGEHLVFNAGQYAPKTGVGMALLAHELAHSLQQLGSSPAALASADARPAAQIHGPIGVGVARAPQAPVESRADVHQRVLATLKKIQDDGTLTGPRRLAAVLDLCESVPTEHAAGLAARLEPGAKGDEFAKYVANNFSAERAQMLAALHEKARTDPTPAGGDVAAEAKAAKELEAGLAQSTKELTEGIARGRTSLAEAEKVIADAAPKLDPDLVDIVEAQAESMHDTFEMIEGLLPVLAAMPADQRAVVIGAATIELQMLYRNAEHLKDMNKIVAWDVPPAVENVDEVEEKLTEYTDWHESWIETNAEVGGLASDLVGLLAGEDESIQIDLNVAQHFIDYQKRGTEEGKAMGEVDKHVDEIIAEGKKIQDRADAAGVATTVAEILMALRGRRFSLRRPPRFRGRAVKRTRPTARPRKQLRRTASSKKASKKSSAKQERRKKRKEKRKEKKSGAYPLCWPVILRPPMLAGVPVTQFIRTPGVDREPDVADQQRQQLRYRQTVEPAFVAGRYHVHHSVPLFLGGLDSPMNMTLIEGPTHLKGHRQLQHQPQMLKPPGKLKPLPENLYTHPAGTRYYLKGFKTDVKQTC